MIIRLAKMSPLFLKQYYPTPAPIFPLFQAILLLTRFTLWVNMQFVMHF